jgi:hypothetical protein
MIIAKDIEMEGTAFKFRYKDRVYFVDGSSVDVISYNNKYAYIYKHGLEIRMKREDYEKIVWAVKTYYRKQDRRREI